MTWAYGKVILFGEHAVVYGFPALAGALDLTVEARFLPRPDGADLRLRAAAWRDLDIDCKGLHLVARAVRALIAEARERFALDEHMLSGIIEIHAGLPAAAGLGSSAALCVAVARLLAEISATGAGARVSRGEVTTEHIEAVAGAGERCFHENPSGVDVALAARGGLGLFVRGRGLEPIDAAPVPVAIGLSGEPRRTADMVARVAERRARQPARTQEQLAALGDAAMRGRDALERAALADIGALMTQAQDILARLGVSSEALDRLVATALDAGALGAKLTGAGGGGAVIAAAHDLEHAARIADVWRAHGVTAFAARVGMCHAGLPDIV
jgi:mevalonate kinase